MTEHRDPFFERWAARQRPPLTRAGRAGARIEHAASHDALATIDAELDTLCARRRAVLDRLNTLRRDLWPDEQRCHHRRRGRVDEVPMPPAPPGSEALGGVELRATCLGILRRQGPCGLRELHGLLHRHGYRIDGPRAVQSLADAMAYEVRQGRAHRLARGVYGAVAAGPDPIGVEALPWDDPDEDRPQLDPVVLDDPERWGGPSWPDPPDPPARPGAQVRPPDRYDPSTLDDDVRRARARSAALADELARERRRAVDPDPSHPGTPADPDGADDARWERFVDESVPTVRIWAARRRVQGQQAAERARRREEGGGSHLWGDDPAPEDP